MRKNHKKSLSIFVLGLLLSVCFSGVAFADDDYKIMGTITATDVAQKQFSIKTDQGPMVTVTTNPATDFEIEHKGRRDEETDFSGLQVGDWVKVECNGRRVENGPCVAEDVEIYKK